MPALLSASEVTRRAVSISASARRVTQEPRAKNRSAQTRRYRAALGRALRLLKPLANPRTVRGKVATEGERRKAAALIDKINRMEWKP